MDVKVLLSGIKYNNLTKINTKHNIDLVIFDKLHKQTEVDNFIKTRIANVTKGYKVVTLDAGKFVNFNKPEGLEAVYKHIVLGGTFDRLHVAHKLLLSEAALLSNSTVTVGVTEENMLQSEL